jgi:hypothetical protein
MLAALLLVAGACALAAGGAVAAPRETVAEVVWDVPGESDDFLLGGLLVAAAWGPDGDLLVLDYANRDCKVFAAADGAWLRTLGREGEGPGESRDARGLVVGDDGRIGLLQMFPATVVWLDGRDGSPAGRTRWREAPDASGGFVGLAHLAVDGARWFGYVTAMKMRDGKVLERHWIVPVLGDGTFGEPLYRRDVAQPEPDAAGRFDEGEYHDVWAGRWTPDGHGGVWVAAERDAYVVQRLGPGGEVVAEIRRDEAGFPRDQLGRDQALARMVRKRKDPHEVRVRDAAPLVRRLRRDDSGRLWVDRDLGGHGPAPGTIAVTDVFAADGTWQTQLRVTGPFDAATDQSLWVDDTHLLVMRAERSGEVRLRLLRLRDPLP